MDPHKTNIEEGKKKKYYIIKPFDIVNSCSWMILEITGKIQRKEQIM
jgi:hypothetical protein